MLTWSSSQRRVLTTQWVGNAWNEIKENKDFIIRSFLKCGSSNKLDESDSINDLEDYRMPEPEELYTLEDDSIDQEDGPEVTFFYPSDKPPCR